MDTTTLLGVGILLSAVANLVMIGVIVSLINKVKNLGG